MITSFSNTSKAARNRVMALMRDVAAAMMTKANIMVQFPASSQQLS